MKLEREDYPLIVAENRIYARRRRDEPILVALDAEMARSVAEQLDRAADMVWIERIDLGDARQVERFLRERDADKG